MGTVSTLAKPVGNLGNPSRKPYFVEVEIDIAAWATAEGGALVANDIVQAITVDATTAVLFAGMECTETPGGGTGTVLDLGITGGDVDAFVDGFAFDSATAGDYAAMANTATPIVLGAGDTIDVLIQAATTGSTSGKFRVFACLMDLDSVGSDKGADEVVRDQLA